jgi:hypothetical protein
VRTDLLLDAEGGRTRPLFRLGVGCDSLCTSARTSSSAPARVAVCRPHRATAHRGGASPTACPCVRVHLVPRRPSWCASPPPSPPIRLSDPCPGLRLLPADILFAPVDRMQGVLTAAPRSTASRLDTRHGAFVSEEVLSDLCVRPRKPVLPGAAARAASIRLRPTLDARRRWLGVAPTDTCVVTGTRRRVCDRMVLPRRVRAFPLTEPAVRGR